MREWLNNKLYNMIKGDGSLGLRISNVVRGSQVGADEDVIFANDDAADTQVTVDVTLPTDNITEYLVELYNPSTESDLTCKVFATELAVDSTNTRYALLTTLSFDKAATVKGTALNMTAFIIRYLFSGADLRLVFSNDTLIGAAGGFTGILRIKECS